MGFGSDLQGKISHDALIRLQDTEIKLLETFKKCILLRIDSDKKYASSLSSVIQQAQKVDYTEFGPHCYTFKVWDKLWSETDNFVKLLKGNNEELSAKTVEKIASLISDKKSARKYYLDERNRLESEFTKIQEEAQKNKQEYCKLADRVKGDKARFEDLCVKGKTGGKFDDSKSKYYKNTVRLHKQHNDYLISLAETREHQAGYLDHVLPSLLDYHQATQELYVQKSKEVFEDYCKYTNFSTSQFQNIYKSIDLSLEGFKPDREYTGEFITNYRSDAITPSLFEFDNKILDDYKGPLRIAVLAVDDLTLEPLKNKKTNFEEYIRKLQTDLEDKERSLAAFQSQLDDVERKLAQDKTPEGHKEFFHKKKSVELAKKDASEVKANFNKQKSLLEFINEPLSALGDSLPPSALDLTNIAETTSQDDLVKSDTESKADELNKSSSVQQKDAESILSGGSIAKRKKFSLGNILKKGTNDVKVRKDQESYEQAETDLSHNGPLPEGCVNENSDGPVSLEDQEYFHGVLPREEVQRLLVNDGDFLVRESRNKKSNEVQYVLSVHWQGYKHFIIQYGEGGWRFEGPAFATIPELLTYQEHCNKPVTNKSQAILKSPIYREEWELKNDDVCLEMKIGNGNFGEVYKGVYRPKGIVVAVKTCKDTLSEDQRKKFLQEGRILKQYDHPNIVRFIGIAAQRQPVMIVMEYVSGGALLNFLREHGKNQNKKKLAYMCVDASNGMAYLESKNCIHRDLAARNCLIGDNNCVKISDFGMSREEEEYTLSGGMKQIPIKWTAPEALHFGRYTCLSDVWSFGVLMWEIFSLGTTPYKGMTNAEARDWIDSNHRMASPPGTPHEVYRIMKQCWEYDSDKRPHFNELYNRLKSIADSLV